ncbi:MAG TPA: CoA transferase [Hyphomicrobiaceae bacterium]|jgi:crotonobetainyl-CoA:carnitine CoA-transferase CaiB-like acyl-CoA transferase|nr:CoA transferase [Hyphomicrobiaceae bacterium]
MLPLTGVKVIELANNIAGPYAGFILAALGADVLKVERPEGGDDARGWGPPFWHGTSATFQALNVNKRGLTLDLKDPAQIAQLKVLVSEADVLVHNLRSGVLDALGLGSPALTALNPRLVYCSISAFGPKGPMQRHPGYEPIVQAFAGLFSINGYPDRPGVRIGTSVLDLGSATWAALGCIAGLLERERTGKGCTVDASLYETALGLLTVHFARYQVSGELPERQTSGSLAVVIFQAFDTADGRVIVAAANDRLFAKFAVEVGHPEWVDDARYKTNADRHANRATLIPEVAGIMRRETSATWQARLEKAGVPCSAINDMAQMRAHPQTAALGMVQPVPGIDLDLMSLPLSLDGQRPNIRTRAPTLGEHNAQVGAPQKAGQP